MHPGCMFKMEQKKLLGIYHRDSWLKRKGQCEGERGGSAMTATPSNADVQQAVFSALAKQFLMSAPVSPRLAANGPIEQ